MFRATAKENAFWRSLTKRKQNDLLVSTERDQQSYLDKYENGRKTTKREVNYFAKVKARNNHIMATTPVGRRAR